MARLHLKLISDKAGSHASVAAVRHALATLPTELDETYQETISRTRSGKYKELAHHALVWVAYATSPLTVEELRHAIAWEMHPDALSIEEDFLPNIETVLASCRGLLVVMDDEQRAEVRLVRTSDTY